MGSRQDSGIPQSGGTPGKRGLRSEGGVGAAVYSVRAKPFILGEVSGVILGEVSGVVTPLATGWSDMLMLREIDQPENPQQENSMTQRRGFVVQRNPLIADSFFPRGSGIGPYVINAGPQP